MVVGELHSCAVTVSGEVRCWGDNRARQSTPPDDLGAVAQLSVGILHSCVLTVSGRVRCWGPTTLTDIPGNSSYLFAQATPPEDLGPVAQLAVGESHSCALTVSGRVRCWGNDGSGQSTPPDDLGVVAQISVGGNNSCALTVSGGLRCWGAFDVNISSLPPGTVMAVDFGSACALLADGSVYCESYSQESVPPELRPGDVVMSVWPRQLLPGQRAAIRFTDLRETTGAFTARIEVFGEGDADVSSYYRLLDRNGMPLLAEQDGRYRLVWRGPADPPMAWLEATGANRSSLLYVRPIELLSASGPAPSIRVVAQSVELIDGVFFSASADTLSEGTEEAQLSIWLPLAHVGLRVEMELAVSGTAVEGSDYTLVTADPEQGIVLGGEATDGITLRVDSAPTPTEPLRLLLRSRADDRISQVPRLRLLNLRISRYRVVPESEGTVDLPPALGFTILDDEPPTVQQVLVGGLLSDFACIHLSGGALRCRGSNFHGQDTPDDLGPVVQLAVGGSHGCALTVSGRVRCWGRNIEGQTSPPVDLARVAQIGVGEFHSCALTVSGRVRCWGDNEHGQSSPPDDLGSVVQLAVGYSHSCALTVSRGVRCWGDNTDGRSTPLVGLGPVAQLAVGREHGCALTVLGLVYCWGNNDYNQATPPDDLGPVAQLVVGRNHSCALTVAGELRCWGIGIVEAISYLPPGAVTAIADSGLCVLLAEGSVYCLGRSELIPPELRPGEVVMSVWPRQLQPGQRAAIRFTELLDVMRVFTERQVFTARIEVFGEKDTEIGSYYRLLNHNGQPLRAEPDGSYHLVGAGESPPMAWLEALGSDTNRPLRLYVRPIELLSVSGSTPSIRMVAQSVELSAGPFFTASTDTVTEGAEEAQLSIVLPLAHSGLRVELELAVIGTAVEGSDYTLEAADPEQGIVLGGEANSTITLRVESAPTEPLRLRLRPRVDDDLSQGPRLLNLRISRYRVVPEGEGTVVLPPALDFTLRDDEPQVVRQVLGDGSGNVICTHLNDGLAECWGTNYYSQPPVGLGPVVQLAVGGNHSCALTVSGRVRCWDWDFYRGLSPPEALGPVVQIGVGYSHSCALTVEGRVRCWGSNEFGKSTPPDNLSAVAQLGVGNDHSCALTVSGQVHCWGNNGSSQSLSPRGLGRVAQLAVGSDHNCALTVAGEVRCWGASGPFSSGQSPAPEGLGVVVQISVGNAHSCALTVSDQVRCWGGNEQGQSSPLPEDLGRVAQLALGRHHSCALTVSGRVHCWGDDGKGQSTPPETLGAVAQLAVGKEHSCALTVGGRVRCWGSDRWPPTDLGLVTRIVAGPYHSCALTVAGWRCWGADTHGRASPPADLGRVAQLGVGEDHSCALSVAGGVRCWGDNEHGQSSPPADLGPIAQLGVGAYHNCALTVAGGVRCWGMSDEGQALPPVDLGLVAQLSVGAYHSCALTISGQVYCWGRNNAGQSSPLGALGQVKQIAVGRDHSCALQTDGRLRCWGRLSAALESLPSGAVVTAIDASGNCALLAEGALHCSDGPVVAPPELSASDVVMSVWPRQLQPGQRAAIRFADLRETTGTSTTGAFTAQIEVFGERDTDIGDYYRLLARNGQPLRAEQDGSYLVTVSPATSGGYPWLEALDSDTARPLRLYIRPLEVQDASGLPLSIRKVAQSVELIDGLFFSASTDTVTEGAEEAQLSIRLPRIHSSLRVELELAVGGTALVDSDYTLVAADPEQGIVLGGEANSTITLRVESAPAEPLRLILRARMDDRLSQGPRLLNLRISRYRAVPEGGRTVDLPPALDLTIRDDEPQVVRQVLGNENGNVICARLNGGSVRCWGANFNSIRPPGDLSPVAQLALGDSLSCALTVEGQVRCWDWIYYGGASSPPEDLGPVVQLSVGIRHSCALTVSGQVRCWGWDFYGQSSPPKDLDPVAQLGVGEDYSCALQTNGQVRCWGDTASDRSPAPGGLGPVAQISVGWNHSCVLTVSGHVSCWGRNIEGQATPPPELGPDGALGLVAQLAMGGFHSCALTVAGGVRCWGHDRDGRSTPPGDLGLVAQIGVGFQHSCALTVSGRVSCWGSDRDGRSTPPADLGPVAQIGVGTDHSCALTVGGGVRCWGGNEYGQSSPPVDLSTVVQIDVGRYHSCALTISGRYCWGQSVSGGGSSSLPPGDLGRVAQISVGGDHSCALMFGGGVRCWGGGNRYGQATPPDDLGPVAQVGAGEDYSCALQTNGQVRCWGNDRNGLWSPPANLGPVAQLSMGTKRYCVLTVSGRVRCRGDHRFGGRSPPADLGTVVQLSIGITHSCALQTDGQLRCWGDSIAIPSLPSGAVTAIDASGSCALLAEGSLYCPNYLGPLLPEPRPGDVIMSVWPRQLQPGQRAAIRFADLRETTGAFTARIEVFGERAAEIGSYYRLLDGSGIPLETEVEADGSYRYQLQGNPPMAWLEATGDDRSSRLYVRPLELLSASGPDPSIRVVAQPVELSDGLFFTASTDALAEGTEEAQLSIWLPVAHTGLRVEMELAVGGTARTDVDYTLVAADPKQGIVLGGEGTDDITLRVESAPTEPLRLRLRTRADDRISQGDRLLTLRISRYQVVPEGGGTVDLPPALDFTIRDDEPPTAQQVLVEVNNFFTFSCVHLNGGSVRCWGPSKGGQAMLPDDLGPVAQLSVGSFHSCALTVVGGVRCWGDDRGGRSSPPDDLGPVAQIGVGYDQSCALTVSGRVRCWGPASGDSRFTLPGDHLGPFAQLVVGGYHSCARTVSGQVHCWGRNIQATPPDDLGPVAQLVFGGNHSCALTVSGQVRCWGRNSSGQSTPPEDLSPVVQLGLGGSHSCALSVSGRVRCWGADGVGQSTPPEGLGPVVQLAVGEDHSCALTVSGQLRCWGKRDISSLGPGLVTAIEYEGACLLLADGSVHCPGRPVLVPPELRPGKVVMWVVPRQLQPGQRAAIGFADLRGGSFKAFTARIEVFGEKDTDIGSYYRLLDRNGMPLRAESDGSYRLVGEGNPPMAWLEALGDGRPSRLYVRPLGLLSASGPDPSIRKVAQPVELIDGVFFTASTDTLSEGTEEAQLSIWLPLAHTGLQVELELAVSGTTMGGLDYTLEAADPAQGIVLGGAPTDGITLRVESVPTPTEPLRLRLRPRADDRISQGDRLLTLRISRYTGGFDDDPAIVLPPALDFTIIDDESPLVTVAGTPAIGLGMVCAPLVEGRPRCWYAPGLSSELQAMLQGVEALDSVRQIALGDRHVCWLQTDGTGRCAGAEGESLSDPSAVSDFDAAVQIVAGRGFRCALSDTGRVSCSGRNDYGQSSPPAELRAVVQLAAGREHGCALTEDGTVHCWGRDNLRQSSPPDDLGPAVQIAAGYAHSCAVTVSGGLRCWGWDALGQASPPVDMDPVLNVALGRWHSCALTEERVVSCWGGSAAGQLAVPSLPAGMVVAVAAGGDSGCAVLAEGSLRCWGGGLGSGLPAELGPGDVLMSVLPRRLQPGQCAAVRFADRRAVGGTVDVRLRLSGEGLQAGVHYRLLDAAAQPLNAETDGSWLLRGQPVPQACIEALDGASDSSLQLDVRVTDVLPNPAAALSVRGTAQRVELWKPETALTKLRVVLPSGTSAVVARLGERTAQFSVQVHAFDAADRYIGVTGLKLVAERVAGSAASWTPQPSQPEALFGTDRAGVFGGLLRVTLGEDDGSAQLRVGVVGGDESAQVVVNTTTVEVVRMLDFGAAGTLLREGMDGVELRIGIPLAHVGAALELELVASGAARMDLDYTLVAAVPEQGIELLATSANTVTLRVAAAPAEPLMLLLRPRAADRASQGERRLTLAISGYRAGAENTAGLPPALHFSLSDDELPVSERLSAVGGRVACAQLDGGTMRCWHGAHAAPELRRVLGSTELRSARQLALGLRHVCWLNTAGQVACAGSNDHGQLDVPTPLPAAVSVVAGWEHSCVITVAGQVRCWGRDDYEQSSPPTGSYGQLALGRFHSCGLRVDYSGDGDLHCWGGNDHGQASPPDNRFSRSLVERVQLASGEAHNCLLIQGVESGPESLICWGRNDHGQASPPRDLALVMQLALGEDHSCALQVDGMVRCWGRSDLGQLAVPVFPAGLVTAIMSAPHSHSSCAQLADGSLRCWGGDELADSVPAQLRFSGVVMSVGQPPPGQRAVIRFVDYRATTATFRVRVELFGDVEVAAGIDYRLLDPAGKVLVAEPDGSYLLGGEPLPMALVEALDATVERPLLLYIRAVELLSAAPPPRVSMRDQAQVELTTGLARLRVSVPEGNIVLAAARSTDTVHIGVRVEALDAMSRPVDSTGLLLVAESIAGSLADWSPTADQPRALSETDERGIFAGRLSVRLGADDVAVRLRLGVVGFEMGLGIVVESTVVEVLRIPALAFTAGAAQLTEGGDDVELRIELPLSHIGSHVEMVLTGSGTARLGSDYSLVAADSEQNIVIGDGIGMALTLEVQSAPAEALRLLLHPRSDNRIRQGDRSFELRLSDYRADAEDDRAVILPPALRFEVVDDELPVVQKLLAVGLGSACAFVDEGTAVRCWYSASAPAGSRVGLNATAVRTAQEVRISLNFVCWVQPDGTVGCAGEDQSGLGLSNVPEGLSAVTVLEVGLNHSCAVYSGGLVSCWGRNDFGQATPPEDLGPVAQLAVGDRHSCALTVSGEVRCWGRDDLGQSSPPEALSSVVQLAGAYNFTCALTETGRVRCWGRLDSSLPDDLASFEFAQLAAGGNHVCGLTASGRVRCWGSNASGQSWPPDDLAPVRQLALGESHSCVLQVDGRVRCWGRSAENQLKIPLLPPQAVVSLVSGYSSNCVVLAEGSVRCWGGGLGDAVPAALGSHDVAMSVLPRRLQPGQRAAIRFDYLRELSGGFHARVELFGDDVAPGVHYRLLNAAGDVLAAQEDGSYLLAGVPLLPMAYIEALDGAVEPPLQLYVRAAELFPLPVSGLSWRDGAMPVELAKSASALSSLRVSVPAGAVQVLAPSGEVTAEIEIRVEALDAEEQRVGVPGLTLAADRTGGSAASWSPLATMPEVLIGTSQAGVYRGLLRVTLGADDAAVALQVVIVSFAAGEFVGGGTLVNVVRGLNFTAAVSTLTEGMADVELRIELPFVHLGSPIEIDLAVGGTAVLAKDYTLLAADAEQGIVLGSTGTGVITLRVESAPDEALRLLLRPRADDQFSQGDRDLSLSIVRYTAGAADVANALPAVLRFSIVDDELRVVQRLLAVDSGMACALLSGGAVRCWDAPAARNRLRAVADLANIRSPRQLGIGRGHLCWLDADGKPRCAGDNSGGLLNIPPAVSTATALVVGAEHSCVVYSGGLVRCWGANGSGQSTPPEDLGPVVQIAAGSSHSCALTVAGRVRCWGSDTEGKSSPPADLGPVAQIAVGSWITHAH